MKVSEVGEKGATRIVGMGKEMTVQSAQKGNFVEALKKVEGQQIQQELEDLLADIDQRGKRMVEHRSIEELQGYKNKVKDFLSQAVKKIYKLKEDMGFDRRGRHKIYSLVEKVNKGLEELTTAFMDKQQDNLAIIAKVDEIRGLLLDIYM